MTNFEFIAHWIATTRKGWMLLKVMEFICFVVGVLIAIWAVYMIETRFFPVIKGWQLDYVARAGDTYTLSGSMHKTRVCELISTNVLSVPKTPLAPRVLLYKISPQDIDGGNAPTGHMQWGPWTMQIPQSFLSRRDEIAFIEVVGIHRCHAWWNQETYYGRITMEQLP